MVIQVMMIVSTPVGVGPMAFEQDICDVSGNGGDIDNPNLVLFVATNAVDIPLRNDS